MCLEGDAVEWHYTVNLPALTSQPLPDSVTLRDVDLCIKE